MRVKRGRAPQALPTEPSWQCTQPSDRPAHQLRIRTRQHACTAHIYTHMLVRPPPCTLLVPAPAFSLTHTLPWALQGTGRRRGPRDVPGARGRGRHGAHVLPPVPVCPHKGGGICPRPRPTPRPTPHTSHPSLVWRGVWHGTASRPCAAWTGKPCLLRPFGSGWHGANAGLVGSRQPARQRQRSRARALQGFTSLGRPSSLSHACPALSVLQLPHATS